MHIDEPDHFPAFSELNYQWIQAYFVVEASDRKALNNPGAIVDGGGHILTLTEGGKVVACCALLKQPEGDFELAKMAVDEAWRGQGLAKKLMQAAIATAKEDGAHRLNLLTSSKLAPALALYEQFGFVRKDVACHPDYARCDVVKELKL